MSAKKAPSAAPPEETRLYAAAVEATEGAELKGATTPYTSLNGNMYSFLDKQGVFAVRLGAEERAELIGLGGTDYVYETGHRMREYVGTPADVLADTQQAAAWLAKSLAYAGTLKPKATTRKKKSA